MLSDVPQLVMLPEKLPRSSLTTTLQRILLSEASLILQAWQGKKSLSGFGPRACKVCAWEMRLVWPSGRPPVEHLDGTADILGQQTLVGI